MAIRHPNGYGTVVKLSGNRRNPFVARKTKGWNEKGYPIFDVIGYYPTKQEGLIALAQYNASPWDIQHEKITLAELYQLWLEKKSIKLGKSNLGNLKNAFRHSGKMHNVKYKEIKSYHIQALIDNCGRGHGIQRDIKNLFYHLDRFALEIDLITRSYSDLVTVASAPESNKTIFSDEEIRALWGVADKPWVDTALIFLYSGWRISELLSLKCADVDLKEKVMRGGNKTKSGKNRIVPIHPKIFPLIERRVHDGGEYLLQHKKRPIKICMYYTLWQSVMNMIDTKHTVHETRHTFRSRLDSAGANHVCIDLIMGHKSDNIGERVYTHKTIDELKKAIELITE